MNDLTHKLAGLRTYCMSIREQALTLSALTPEQLESISGQVEIGYATWCDDQDLAGAEEPVEAFTGFGMMLRDWPTPWPSSGIGTELDGATVDKVLLAIAYDRAGAALYWMATAPQKGSKLWANTNCAACVAIDAARFLDEAKRLISAGDIPLFQHADEEELAI